MAQRTIRAHAVVIDHSDADLPLFPCETIRRTLEHEARRLTRELNEKERSRDECEGPLPARGRLGAFP